jgi:hypothetical protein
VQAQRTAKATDKAAGQAQQDAMAGLSDQLYQANQQATDQMVARSKQAVREAGAMNAIFADSGLAGASQDRLLAEAEANAQADLTTIERNRTNRENQGQSEAAAIRARAQSEVNKAPRPSLLGTGLQIAAAGADYYARKQPGK